MKYGNKTDFNIHIGTTDDGPYFEKFMKDGATVKDLHLFGSKFSLITIFRLISYLRKEKFDLVHTHGARAGFFFTIASLFSRVPSIHTSHGYSYENKDQFAAKRFYVFIEKLISLKSNKIGCVSHSDKNIALSEKVARKEKLVVVQNGIDFINSLPDSDLKLREFYNIGSNPLVGTVGRITKQKGPFLFLDVVELLLKEYPTVKAVWIGDGDLKEAMTKEIANRKLNDFVYLYGSKSDASRVMKQFDVFLMTSLFEPFGLTALEAMYSKVPIVASKAGALPSIITHDVTGRLFDLDHPKQAVISIMQALEEKKSSMITSAFHHVTAAYDARKMVKEYEALYHEILQTGNSEGSKDRLVNYGA
ncbi:hypothetical protein AS29_001600 [Bacillus sp. SJS]|nr:hypothetical protein AS29_001600 [Bacillus sp. SJS]